VHHALAAEEEAHAVFAAHQGQLGQNEFDAGAAVGGALDWHAVVQAAGARDRQPRVGFDAEGQGGRGEGWIGAEIDAHPQGGFARSQAQVIAVCIVAAGADVGEAGLPGRCRSGVCGCLLGVGRRGGGCGVGAGGDVGVGVEEQGRVKRLGDLARRVPHPYRAMVEPERPIADGLDVVHGMRAEEDGRSTLLELHDAVEGLARELSVTHRQGFVDH
jgi:hypothetical protein